MVIVFPTGSAVSWAGTIPAFAQVGEVMIAAENADGIAIGRFFGTDNKTTLFFTSSLDVSGQSFTYSLVPGSTYRGLEMTLNTKATFNEVSNRWEWSTLGSLGDQTWTASGTVHVIGDPIFDIDWKGLLLKLGKKIDLEGGVNASLKSLFPPEVTSEGSLTLTLAGEKVGSVTVNDTYKDGAFNWNVTTSFSGIDPENGFRINGGGMNPFPQGGAGTFTMDIVSVPEPSTIALLSLGTVSLLGYGWRCRKKLIA
jgi:hypothetical protein